MYTLWIMLQKGLRSELLQARFSCMSNCWNCVERALPEPESAFAHQRDKASNVLLLHIRGAVIAFSALVPSNVLPFVIFPKTSLSSFLTVVLLNINIQ